MSTTWSSPRKRLTTDLNNPPGSVSKYARTHAVAWKATAVAWAALIFYLSTSTFGGSFTASLLARALRFLHLSLSGQTFDTLHFLIRKAAHLTEYAILTILLYGSREEERPFDWRLRRALACVAIAGGYSLTDEFHQLFVPGRGASLADCGIDTVGSSLGVLVFFLRKTLLGIRG